MSEIIIISVGYRVNSSKATQFRILLAYDEDSLKLPESSQFFAKKYQLHLPMIEQLKMEIR